VEPRVRDVGYLSRKVLREYETGSVTPSQVVCLLALELGQNYVMVQYGSDEQYMKIKKN
jgi:hypothetical protein